jgi:hypothetical protein
MKNPMRAVSVYLNGQAGVLQNQHVNINHILRMLPGNVGHTNHTAVLDGEGGQFREVFSPASTFLHLTDGSILLVAGRPESVLASWASQALDNSQLDMLR